MLTGSARSRFFLHKRVFRPFSDAECKRSAHALPSRFLGEQSRWCGAWMGHIAGVWELMDEEASADLFSRWDSADMLTCGTPRPQKPFLNRQHLKSLRRNYEPKSAKSGRLLPPELGFFRCNEVTYKELWKPIKQVYRTPERTKADTKMKCHNETPPPSWTETGTWFLKSETACSVVHFAGDNQFRIKPAPPPAPHHRSRMSWSNGAVQQPFCKHLLSRFVCARP